MKPIAKRPLRACALALAAVQLFTAAAGAAFDSAFSYSYPVAEGTSYTRAEGKNAAGLQKASILTYTPNGTVTPRIVYAGDKLYGSRSAILNAASFLESGSGQKVIGGVNADFFVLSSSIPIGLVIDQGTLISSDAWQYAVGFQADGTALVGRPTMDMKLAGASGTVSVSYFNKTRTTAGAYLLDRNYDSSTHFTADGIYIILEHVDPAPVRAGGAVKLKVVGKGTGNTPVAIGENQLVLTKSDGAQVPSWVDYPVGEEITLTVGASDTRWNDVQYAVGGKLLLENGAVTTAGIDAASSRTARSAVGVKADGTVVLYEVDGLQASHSAGLTAAELGNEMKALGCVSALCLDGGGSSVMALKQPGEAAASIVTKPSDGSPRAVANYIFFVSNAASDGVTAHAVLTPSYRYVMPGASTWFSVRGADSAFGPAEAPSELTYAVSDDLGAVDGQTFTAGEKTGNAVISASNGAVDGEMTVCVTDAVDSIALQSAEKEIGSISLKPGQSIELDAVAYHQNMKMAAADALFTWSAAGGVGTVSGTGAFTAGQTMASGTLTCSYGGTKKTLGVNIGMGDPQDAALLSDFETAQPCAATAGIALTRETDRAQVARGNGALKAAFDGDKVAAGTISLPPADVSAQKYLSLWARSSGTPQKLTAVFTDAAGGELTAPLSAVTTDGWQQLSAEIPADAQTLTGLRMERSGTGAAESALWLDQIVVSAHHAVTNADAPAIRLDRTAVAVSANAAASITGSATMESGNYPVRASGVSVKIDGKPAAGAAKMNGSALTVTTGALSAGTHCVTIDVTDDAGNRARAAATVTAGGAGAAVYEDTGASWAKGYASLLNAAGVMTGETQNGKRYFRPERNLRRMEFAVTMARVLGLDTSYSGTLAFADDDEIPSWARGAVYAVSKAGVMGGQNTQGRLIFAPEADITRAEVMTVIGRSLPRGYAAAALRYKDAASVPSWAADSVKTCVSAGIVGGYSDNTLRPNAKITRAEIAKILALL